MVVRKFHRNNRRRKYIRRAPFDASKEVSTARINLTELDCYYVLELLRCWTQNNTMNQGSGSYKIEPLGRDNYDTW
jgi:hypothetical protein